MAVRRSNLTRIWLAILSSFCMFICFLPLNRQFIPAEVREGDGDGIDFPQGSCCRVPLFLHRLLRNVPDFLSARASGVWRSAASSQCESEYLLYSPPAKFVRSQ